jgi:hypothetical protein
VSICCDQPSAGPCEFLDDDGVSACQNSASGIGPESHRLAADSLQLPGWMQPPNNNNNNNNKPKAHKSLRSAAAIHAEFVQQSSSAGPPQVRARWRNWNSVAPLHSAGISIDANRVTMNAVSIIRAAIVTVPLCSGAKRADWLIRRSTAAARHYVFSGRVHLPDQLSSLALGNRKEIYDLLFRSAWKTLRDAIADEQHFEAAAAMVLHTWNQKLEAHAHVHALVPGGGPSLTGDRRWIKSRRPNVKHCDGRYLCRFGELKSNVS